MYTLPYTCQHKQVGVYRIGWDTINTRINTIISGSYPSPLYRIMREGQIKGE